jgi:DNA (cytosine-5)-methyltransferase 1
MKALDLFAGVGWHIGASALDIEEEGVEIMREAVATRDAIGAKTVHDDVWTFDYATAIYEGHIASPPCQSFSMAGKGAGRKALDDVLTALRQGAYKDITALHDVSETVGDDRTALVLTPLHAWHVQRPEWVAWEQVPTVQPVWDACAEVMREAGYSVWTGRLQAEQYGVPQTRKRSILIASRTREVGAPTPTHSKYYPRTPQKLDEGVEKWMSMAEGIGWGFVQRPSYTYTGVSAHAMGDQEWGGASVRRALREARDSGDLARWCYERPATTIVGSFKPEIVAAPGYRTTVSRQNAEGSVRVDVHEAGLLQSFPADMPWQGSKSKQYLQVGNAVPPGLAIPVLGEATGLPWQEVSKTYRDSIYAL